MNFTEPELAYSLSRAHTAENRREDKSHLVGKCSIQYLPVLIQLDNSEYSIDTINYTASCQK